MNSFGLTIKVEHVSKEQVCWYCSMDFDGFPTAITFITSKGNVLRLHEGACWKYFAFGTFTMAEKTFISNPSKVN